MVLLARVLSATLQMHYKSQNLLLKCDPVGAGRTLSQQACAMVKATFAIVLFSQTREQHLGIHCQEVKVIRLMSGTRRERHLANMAWSCARLRVNPCNGALLDAACAELVANPNGFSVQNMANIVLAAGILQHPIPQPVVDLVCTPQCYFRHVLCHDS